MKFKVIAAILFTACFLTGISVAGQKVPPPPPEPKPAISAAENDDDQKHKMLEKYEIALEKREVTLDRAMGAINTSMAVFGAATTIWTIFLAIIGLFGFFEYRRLKAFKEAVEKDSETVKGTIAELEPIAKKIKEYEKEVESARQNTLGGMREMMAGKEEKPSPEVKAKVDELAKKIDFLESFGVELKPEDYLGRGVSFFWEKDYEKALLAFERAIKGGDKLADAWLWKGAALNNLKRYEESLIAFEEAITRNPKSEMAWNNKGSALSWLNQSEEALIAYEQAITLNPKSDAAWVNKGNTLSWLNQSEEALVAIEQAIALNPKNDAAWSGKGNTLNGLKRYDEALVALEQAIALNPKDYAAWGNKGRSLAGLKRIDEAKDAYKKASNFAVEPGLNVYCEACLYSLEGKRQEALAALGKAITLDDLNKTRALRNVEVFGSLFNDPEFKKLTQ